jgi:hypothetical protein
MKRILTTAVALLTLVSAGAQTSWTIQRACHPDDVKNYDTQRLRDSFIMEKVMAPGKILLTYSMYDRLIFGGAMPVGKALKLESIDALKAPYFLFSRELGIINVGGLRNNMPLGTIRRGDIMLISPFDNRLCLLFLQGSDLLSLFRDIAAVHGEGVSSEVRLTITPDGQLLDAKVSGQPVDPSRTYRIATLDYLAEGNDRLYSMKKALRKEVSTQLSRDCMMRYVQRHSPISAKLEGRIKVVNTMDN